MQDKFESMSEQIISRIDDMGQRIDDLERAIASLSDSCTDTSNQQPNQ